MRISIGVGGDVLGVPMTPLDIVTQVKQAAVEGFPAAWSVHFSRGIDALSVLAVAGAQTAGIDLGVGIVPSYPRHPMALAQQAATTQQLSGGRLTLGVGVSHRPVIEGLLGLRYDSPAQHMREYLSVLVPLLTDGQVDFRGSYYRVDGGFVIPGTTRVAVLVGALAPRMVRAAGELADGIITWLAGLRTLENDIVPGVRDAAADSGRPEPRVVAALAVAVCDDRAAGVAQAEQVFARYGGLENYQRLMQREGVASPGQLAVVGTETEVVAQLRRYADVGATEIWATVFPVGDNPASSIARTRSLLAGLAPEL